MRRLASAVMATLCLACVVGFTSPAGRTGGSAPDSALGNQRSRAATSFQSRYTTLETDCRPVERQSAANAGQDIPERCRGYGGYRLYRYSSAAAAHINVETTDGSFSVPLERAGCPLQVYGPRVEWRMARGVPFACIVRITCYNGQTDANGNYLAASNRLGEHLLVVGLRGYERIRFEVETQNTAFNPNERARQLADEAYANR